LARGNWPEASGWFADPFAMGTWQDPMPHMVVSSCSRVVAFSGLEQVFVFSSRPDPV
jgi:hypothetical protein